VTSKARVERLARLVSLRLQQRRAREGELAEAKRATLAAEQRVNACLEQCKDIDQERNDCLSEEIDVSILAHYGETRMAVINALERAREVTAAREQEEQVVLGTLLEAHREHRAVEMIHGRHRDTLLRERAKAEQRELDDIPNRSGPTPGEEG